MPSNPRLALQIRLDRPRRVYLAALLAGVLTAALAYRAVVPLSARAAFATWPAWALAMFASHIPAAAIIARSGGVTWSAFHRTLQALTRRTWWLGLALVVLQPAIVAALLGATPLGSLASADALLARLHVPGVATVGAALLVLARFLSAMLLVVGSVMLMIAAHAKPRATPGSAA